MCSFTHILVNHNVLLVKMSRRHQNLSIFKNPFRKLLLYEDFFNQDVLLHHSNVALPELNDLTF